MPSSSSDDTWDPAVYERFRAERERPAIDLLERLAPAPGGRAADLGCGAGRQTTLVHRAVGASETIGLDTSAQMLSRARERTAPGVRFVEGDIRALEGSWDVLYANAALHWLPDQPKVLADLARLLRPGGQLAFQVPANFDHPSHTVADEVGRRHGLEPLDRTVGALSPAHYAEILHTAGLRSVNVTLHIYGHEMARTDEVIEWVSGSLLTSFRKRLDATAFDRFVGDYRSTLLERLGDPSGAAPYYYAFPRILASASLP